jgi:hypothetical protein
MEGRGAMMRGLTENAMAPIVRPRVRVLSGPVGGLDL